MYPQEKDYIMTGVAATVIFGIFGPTAIVTIWLFVGLFIFSYRQRMHQSEKWRNEQKQRLQERRK